MLTVLTRASTENLVTLERARLGLLGSTSDTTEDALLNELIRSASSAMVGYWGWPFARQQYRETRQGDGGRILCLPPGHVAVPMDKDLVTATIDDVAVTDFVVYDKAIGKLWRGAGWTRSTDTDAPLNISITWRAGWILPDQVRTWTTSLTLAVGDWLRPSSPTKSPLLFEITTAGSSGVGAEPTWPTTSSAAGVTIAVGTATATSRDAEELPRWISELCYVEVYHRYENRAPGLAGQSGAGFSEQYFVTHTDSDLSRPVIAGLDRRRSAIA